MGMVALGFWNLSLKTKTRPFSGECQTIGQHLKRKRLQLGLLQKDVARALNVSEDSVTYWENGRSAPQIRHVPQIIQFLGYIPFQFDTNHFGAIIKKFRIENGLSYRKLGKLFNVDCTTIATWERSNKSIQEINNDEKIILKELNRKQIKLEV